MVKEDIGIVGGQRIEKGKHEGAIYIFQSWEHNNNINITWHKLINKYVYGVVC